MKKSQTSLVYQMNRYLSRQPNCAPGILSNFAPFTTITLSNLASLTAGRAWKKGLKKGLPLPISFLSKSNLSGLWHRGWSRSGYLTFLVHDTVYGRAPVILPFWSMTRCMVALRWSRRGWWSFPRPSQCSVVHWSLPPGWSWLAAASWQG